MPIGAANESPHSAMACVMAEANAYMRTSSLGEFGIIPSSEAPSVGVSGLEQPEQFPIPTEFALQNTVLTDTPYSPATQNRTSALPPPKRPNPPTVQAPSASACTRSSSWAAQRRTALGSTSKRSRPSKWDILDAGGAVERDGSSERLGLASIAFVSKDYSGANPGLTDGAAARWTLGDSVGTVGFPFSVCYRRMPAKSRTLSLTPLYLELVLSLSIESTDLHSGVSCTFLSRQSNSL